VKWIDEVLQVALTHMPTPTPTPETKAAEPLGVEKRRRKGPRSKDEVHAH
jgi:hypothetical protein